MFEYLKHCKAPSSMIQVKSSFDMSIYIQQKPLRKLNAANLAQKFRFTDQQVAEMIGVPLRSYKKMARHSALSIVATEKLISLCELFETGLTTFDGRSPFIAWLNIEVGALNNHKPMELIGSYMGITIVKDLLVRMEYSILC